MQSFTLTLTKPELIGGQEGHGRELKTHSSFYGEHGKLIYVNTMFIVQLVFGKGASIYDVRTEGGRGYLQKQT